MKLRVIAMTIAILAITGSAMAQTGGEIGVFADNMGTSCEITAPLYTPTNFYILAKPNTANTAGGANGAEFRVKGAPAAGILFTSTANPNSNVALGSPFSDESQPAGSRGGANIAFPTCQLPDAQGYVLLYTVSATDISGVADIEFVVDARDPASNANFNCPLITACDGPIFTAVCVTPGRAYLNHTLGGPCTEVAVQQQTWGEVKGLYAN